MAASMKLPNKVGKQLANSKEVNDILKDEEYWVELEELLGWRLIGFSYRLTATYVDKQGRSVNLTGQQRDDIVGAIEWAGL